MKYIFCVTDCLRLTQQSSVKGMSMIPGYLRAKASHILSPREPSFTAPSYLYQNKNKNTEIESIVVVLWTVGAPIQLFLNIAFV